MNKLIIISGGTKGIGRAIAERFAIANYDVAVCARNAQDLLEMDLNWKTKHSGSKLYTFQADLSKAVEANNFAAFVLTKTAHIDILVNNAGLFIQGDVHNAKDGDIEKQIETNLYSAFYLSKPIVAVMKQQKSGHIFNICSVASLLAYPNGGLYSISKFALYGFSKSLRHELMPYGIKVCSVIPGATWSDSWKGVDLPVERLMPASDIAEMIYASSQLTAASDVEEIIIRPQLGDL